MLGIRQRRKTIHGFDQPYTHDSLPKAICNILRKTRIAWRSHPVCQCLAPIISTDNSFVCKKCARFHQLSTERNIIGIGIGKLQLHFRVYGQSLQRGNRSADALPESLIFWQSCHLRLDLRILLYIVRRIPTGAAKITHPISERNHLIEILLSDWL